VTQRIAVLLDWPCARCGALESDSGQGHCANEDCNASLCLDCEEDYGTCLRCAAKSAHADWDDKELERELAPWPKENDDD